MQRFAVLVADPPWRFNDRLGTRGAEHNYPTMSREDLLGFELPPLTDDATLFLWRVASMQQEALDVVRGWGFAPVLSELIWLKKTTYGKRWFGMGRTVRMEHEVCLIAKRGNPPNLDNAVRSTFETDCDGFEARALAHSAKPDTFYEIVELLRAGPYVELFARRHRAGWTCLGNELAQQ